MKTPALKIQIAARMNAEGVTAFGLAHEDKIAKQDWIEAGNAAGDIDLAAVERVIGFPIPKKITDFEDLCAFVFLAIAGEKLPRCNLRGRGFRSQWHAAKVAAVWPEENDKVTVSKAVAAVQPIERALTQPLRKARHGTRTHNQ